MGRTNIAVSDQIASTLSKVAERQNKTSFGLANECLDTSLKILENGGSPDEIYAAWIMNRIGKDVGAFQFVGRNLMERLVAQLARSDDRAAVSKIWYEAGKNTGVYIKMCFPTLDDVGDLMHRAKQSFTIGRVEWEKLPQKTEEQGGDEFLVSAIAPLSSELLGYIAEFWRGLLEVYGIHVLEIRVSSGAASIHFTYDGRLLEVDRLVIQ